ncbi:peptidoglycan-binding domain-containing protein [Stenomitos frigidus]|uniref:Peptidoglycan-binding protein n=1 Tax=Stenomitos frigidus ULC18 TaxID=2107698 RepID=A0A2T1E1D9_9CYAN|nr:peptidoglycan-binding protein [Stenomitos frigidus]PSB26537.1 peptidoglycan-binding protein [Stenomitos frigidus ULC18]
MSPLPHSECYLVLVTLYPSFHQPLLQVGSTDVEVIAIQKLLAHWSLYDSAADGIFSAQVEQALKTFQRRVFLPETGIVDALTWRSLYAGTPIDMPILQRGSQSKAVLLLQKALQADGQTAVVLNSTFDQHTEIAVQTFQRRKGLIVDGIVSNCTWLALSKVAR